MNVWIILFWKWYKLVCKTYAIKFLRPLALLMWISHITTWEQWIYIYIYRPKWPETIVFENFLKFTTVSKIFRNLPPFWNSILWKSSGTFKKFSWCSSSMNSSFIKKFQNFFVVFKFHELKYHWKLDFHTIEFQKGSRLLIFHKQ